MPTQHHQLQFVSPTPLLPSEGPEPPLADRGAWPEEAWYWSGEPSVSLGALGLELVALSLRWTWEAVSWMQGGGRLPGPRVCICLAPGAALPPPGSPSCRGPGTQSVVYSRTLAYDQEVAGAAADHGAGVHSICPSCALCVRVTGCNTWPGGQTHRQALWAAVVADPPVEPVVRACSGTASWEQLVDFPGRYLQAQRGW